MKTLHATTISRYAVLCQRLFKLERQGRYAEALSLAEEFWNDLDKPPVLKDFTELETAEMLLRLGALIGFHGHNKQILGAQSKSKDLLTQARRKFVKLTKIEKVAECANYLALAYWRSGEFKETEIWIEESFSQNLPKSHSTKLYSYIIRSMVHISDGRYEENIKLAELVENDFFNYGNALLNGSFATNIAISYEKLNNHQKNLHYLELARYYHLKSRHKIYLATVENNLAQLYKLEKRFQQAHLASDTATKIFKQIKDHTREGFSLDTKAQIFLHEAKFDEALQTVEKALKILAKTENKGYLVETMLTKIKTLVHLDRISAATECLFEAVEIAKIHIGEEMADNLIREFENTLKEKFSPQTNKPAEPQPAAPPIEEPVFSLSRLQEAVQRMREREFGQTGAPSAVDEGKMEFFLPAELSHYNKIDAIKISTRYFEDVGLKPESLAILVNEDVKCGDLVAICEKETDDVYCGYYDYDFGIVCLEGIGDEPVLFDENEVEMMGKIIGYCEPPIDMSKKLIVKPLDL